MQMFLMSGVVKKTALIYLCIFALMAPLGAVTSDLLQTNNMLSTSAFYPKIMGIVIGIFLHISTTILFETNEQHRFNRYKFLAIISGALLAVLTSL